ncbi:MAG: hypothetical protein ACTH2O_08460, partial [Cellulosimicrobium funkei]
RARAAKELGTAETASRPELARTSLPAVGAALRAGAQTAVRDYAAEATAGVPDDWALAVRRRASEGAADLADALDQAVAGTELEAARRPVWWRVVGAFQWLVLAALVVGLLWLAALWGFTYLRLPEPPTPVLTLGGPGAPELPWPTLLALGGIVVGVLVALVSRAAAAVGGRRRAARRRRPGGRPARAAPRGRGALRARELPRRGPRRRVLTAPPPPGAEHEVAVGRGGPAPATTGAAGRGRGGGG